MKYQDLFDKGFLGIEDKDFRSFVEQMPDTHWAKYDLSAVRLGWEAYKLFIKDHPQVGKDNGI